MRLALGLAAALAVAACASDRVDFGGVANAIAVSGPVVPCEESGLLVSQRGTLVYPAALMQAAYFSQVADLREDLPAAIEAQWRHARGAERICERWLGWRREL